MFDTPNHRVASVPLTDVAFREELPALLGISRIYLNLLLSPPSTSNGDIHRAMKFPKPFYVSPSGICIWFVRDLETWLYSARRYRQGRYQHKIGSTLVERPELADFILGR